MYVILQPMSCIDRQISTEDNDNDNEMNITDGRKSMNHKLKLVKLFPIPVIFYI